MPRSLLLAAFPVLVGREPVLFAFKALDRLSGTGAPNSPAIAHAVFDEAGRQLAGGSSRLATKTQPASAEAKSSTAAPPPVTSQVPVACSPNGQPLVPEGLWYVWVNQVATINQFTESE